MYCFERENKKISMTELFDMIAGSGTGAVISATLVMPNDDPATKDTQKNKYFADKALSFYNEHVGKLYHQ